jgi:4-amino-4-deoxy-L-arabinose transferase-like glycosyltransferase
MTNHSSRARRLPSVIALLLIYAFTRLHHLLALPLFIDESFHIETAQQALRGHVLASATHGRLLRVWLNAILGPDPPAAGWTTRAGTVLIGVLGAAAFYGLARAFASHRAGLIALTLWIGAPYLVFYERMALADSLLGALSVVAVWLAWQMLQKGSYSWAVGLGAALALVILAKASGVVWLPLPAVALLLARGVPWQKRFIGGALAYATIGLLWGPLALVLRWKGYDYFGLASVFVGNQKESLLQRIWQNVSSVWHFDVAYVGLVAVLAAVLGGVYWLFKRPRTALFALLALGMGGGGAIVFGNRVNSRYAFNQVVWVLLPLGVGCALLIERRPRWQLLVYGAIAVWIAVFCAPFLVTAWNHPADLPLYGNDHREYIANEASGYGVTEIGQILKQGREPLPTLGFVASCQTLQLAAYPQDVTCPTINWDGTSQKQIMQQAETWAEKGPIYVVGENLTYIDLSGLPQPYTVITTVERPGSHMPVSLYRIAQGARRPQTGG